MRPETSENNKLRAWTDPVFHSGLPTTEQGHLAFLLPFTVPSPLSSGWGVKKLKRLELLSHKKKSDLKKWPNELKRSGKETLTRYSVLITPITHQAALNDFPCFQPPGLILKALLGARLLFFKSNNFVPLQPSLICCAHGWRGRASWCGSPSQEAAGSNARLKGPPREPRFGRASQKTTAAVGESGPSSLPSLPESGFPRHASSKKGRNPSKARLSPACIYLAPELFAKHSRHL